MAGLVEKVKQSIRSRSKSRRSIGDESRNSGVYDRESMDDTRRSNDMRRSNDTRQYNETRQSNQYQDDRTSRPTNAPPNWTPHQDSAAYADKPLPTNPSSNGHAVDDESRRRSSIARKAVPDTATDHVPVRGSSLRHKPRSNRLSDASDANHMDTETVPPMPDSARSNGGHGILQNNQHAGYNDGYGEQHLSNRMGGMSLGSPNTARSQPGNSIGVSDSLKQRQHANADDHVPPVPSLVSNQHAARDSALQHSSPRASQPNEHVHLPEGFRAGHTEETDVTTEWRPAVTKETVHRDRTEIIHEEITRDIHMHHYYTYVQPIKVVEVLPAKHYTLDPVTGVKTLIPTPIGWTLPENMQSRQPDTSNLQGYTRHYLVNEQHPHGIPEDPPQGTRADHEQVRSTREMINTHSPQQMTNTRSSQPMTNVHPSQHTEHNAGGRVY